MLKALLRKSCLVLGRGDSSFRIIILRSMCWGAAVTHSGTGSKSTSGRICGWELTLECKGLGSCLRQMLDHAHCSPGFHLQDGVHEHCGRCTVLWVQEWQGPLDAWQGWLQPTLMPFTVCILKHALLPSESTPPCLLAGSLTSVFSVQHFGFHVFPIPHKSSWIAELSLWLWIKTK